MAITFGPDNLKVWCGEVTSTLEKTNYPSVYRFGARRCSKIKQFMLFSLWTVCDQLSLDNIQVNIFWVCSTSETIKFWISICLMIKNKIHQKIAISRFIVVTGSAQDGFLILAFWILRFASSCLISQVTIQHTMYRIRVFLQYFCLHIFLVSPTNFNVL